MIITPCISSKLIINTISEEEQISDLVVVESVGGGEFSSENVMGVGVFKLKSETLLSKLA